MEVLPPFAICKPAGRQGGGENLAGGAWRAPPGGVGGVLGLGGKFLFSFFTFTQEVCFQSLVSQGLAGPAQVPVFGRVEWEEMFG